MQEMINREEKMRNILETAQKMKNGTIKPTIVLMSLQQI